jgi:anti-anti-sigma regulatory factor
VLRVVGEVDLGTVDLLTTALTATLRQRPDHLIVDLAEVIFCGARGLAAIAEAGVTATKDGTRFGVSAASALMRRCWAQFWASEQPTQFLTTAAAMNSNSEPPPLGRAVESPGSFPPTFSLELDGWENEGGHLLSGVPESEHLPGVDLAM